MVMTDRVIFVKVEGFYGYQNQDGRDPYIIDKTTPVYIKFILIKG